MSIPERHRGVTTGLTSLALALAVSATGCASSGSPATDRPPPMESTLHMGSSGRVEIRTQAGVGKRSFGVRATEVWEVLPEVFESLDVPIDSRNQAALQMGNAGYLARRVEGKRMSTYVDCGTSLSGVLADAYDITLQLLVQLRAASEADTEVTVTVDAMGEPRSTSGTPIHCTSKRVLEERFNHLLAEALLARHP